MHKVIFDTDPGVDDAMALLFLHRHPDIDLIGVTTVFGNAPIDITTRNALFLNREWQMTAPVAKGAGVTFDPARKEGHWPTFIHGENGLGDIDIPETIDLPLDPLYMFNETVLPLHEGAAAYARDREYLRGQGRPPAPVTLQERSQG